MREIIDYNIIKLERYGDENSILELIKDGWQPFGAPFFSNHNNIYQAMVKYKD